VAISGSTASGASEAVKQASEPIISTEALPRSSQTASEAVVIPQGINGSSASGASDVPASPHPLLRRTANLWAQVCLWWVKSAHPAKGTQFFLICVSAVNAQGQETAPSDRTLVDLH
jgi:hypothetical protein